jgi:hypothetical protein
VDVVITGAEVIVLFAYPVGEADIYLVVDGTELDDCWKTPPGVELEGNGTTEKDAVDSAISEDDVEVAAYGVEVAAGGVNSSAGEVGNAPSPVVITETGAVGSDGRPVSAGRVIQRLERGCSRRVVTTFGLAPNV